MSAASASATAFGSRSRLSRASLSICNCRTAALSTLSSSIGGFLLGAILVDADHRLLAGIDARLRLRGGFLDAQLRQAGLDRLGHAAELLDLVDVAQAVLASS